MIQLKLKYILCWIATILWVGAIIFQIFTVYNFWDEFTRFGIVTYIIFQILILLFAGANLAGLWGKYIVDKYLYENENNDRQQDKRD